MAEFSLQEQLMLELVNRARLDPQAEAARLHIDLNDGLTPGALTATAKPALAPNALLLDATRAHSQFMLDHDKFAHENIGDGDPGTRIQAAGYALLGNNWAYAENIAIQGTTGPANLTALTIANHDGLFKSPDHRENLLGAQYREVGVGIKLGPFVFGDLQTPPDLKVYNAVDVTQNFARSGGHQFITGVAITDANHNNFYDIGEQRAGIVVDARQAGTTIASDTTGTAGGYAIGVGDGRYQVQFHDGDLAHAVNATVLVAANVKLDLAASNEILTSASIALGDGATAASLLGIANLNATGNAEANVLLGNRGANILAGLDGNDKLLGVAGNDKLLGGEGVDTLVGGKGHDQLIGGAGRDIFDFNSLGESGPSATTRDLIRDFVHGLDDIDLKNIDAITGGADNAFKFIGQSSFSHLAGQLHFVLFDAAGSSLDHTVIEGDVNGDARADFQIDLSGLIHPTVTDFIL